MFNPPARDTSPILEEEEPEAMDVDETSPSDDDNEEKFRKADAAEIRSEVELGEDLDESLHGSDVPVPASPEHVADNASSYFVCVIYFVYDLR